MYRIDELKKQYPELNLSIFDMMARMDTSKTYKYLPLMCKIFGKRFDLKDVWHRDDIASGILELQASLINKGISTDGLTNSQMFYLQNYLAEHFSNETYQTLKMFMEYMDKGLIENNDVTSYADLDSIRGALTLATMKELSKELESQIIKEYEDEKWVVLRPLTFSASAKYGSSTRWCTTYQKEKQYFEKYWRKGILVYFINKKTGYKFAGYKGLEGDSEFSFWNAEDSRVDYLDVDADDYLFPIVRKIFKSGFTNKNLCSDEIQDLVHTECLSPYERLRIERIDEVGLDEMPTPTEAMEAVEERRVITAEVQEDITTLRNRLMDAIRETDNEIRELRPEPINVPTMRA